MNRSLLVTTTVILSLSVLHGCTSAPPRANPSATAGNPGAADPESSSAAPMPVVVPAADVALPPIVRAPWTYGGDGDVGEVIETSRFRIHTTARDSRIVDRIGPFMEAALNQYTTTITDLPRPSRAVNTYLFRDRDQWTIKTREVLRNQASDFRNLGRGGFTTGGTAVLYDIGLKDTLSIAAHEGWHQYTQTTFRDPLPLWLEEGVATYMEGFRLSRDGFEFRPWYNWERFGTLRTAVRRGRLIDLEDILEHTPQAFLNEGKNDLLVYYAQGWALVQFLVEGENGRYRPQLERVLRDAAMGTLHDTLVKAMPDRRRAIRGGLGRALIDGYFTDDFEAFRREYLRFISAITQRGAGYAINQGISPIEPDDAAPAP
ncbi:MAG: hypothetical protein KDA25_07970 [Phycisphaerales bacterium]|nr:hypothetical protein [Phycisphaerales bacterium]